MRTAQSNAPTRMGATSPKQSLAVTPTANDKPVSFTDLSGNKVDMSMDIVKRYICPGQQISDADCYGFISLCKYNGYNPFLGDAFAIPRSGKLTMVVAKSALMKRAQKNPKYRGIKSGVVVMKETGEIEYRKGEIYLDNESVIGAWADVYVDGYVEPISAAVNFREYCQYKDGVPQSRWGTAPGQMIVKVAEAAALRRAFPADLSNSYCAEEFGEDEPVKSTVAPPPTSATATPANASYTTAMDAEYTNVDETTGEVVSDDDVQNSFFGQE